MRNLQLPIAQKVLALLLSASLLTACGGGGGSEPPEPEIIIGKVSGEANDDIGSGTSVGVNESLQLAARLVEEDGSVLDITTDSVWETSDSSVASVANGVIVGASPGRAGISVTYTADIKTSFFVDVVSADRLTITPASVDLSPGNFVRLNAVYAETSGSTPVDVTTDVTWSYSPANGVQVVNNILTVSATASGTYTVTGQYQNEQSNVVVRVQGSGNEDSCSISVSPQSINVSAQANITGSCIIDGQTQNVTSLLNCSSQDTNIATVSGRVVAGVSRGTAAINCSYQNLSASETVTVADACPAVVMLDITSSADMIQISETAQFSAVYVNGCDTDNNPAVNWTASSGSISNNGSFTPDSTGSVTITASYQGIDANKTIEVTEQGLTVFFKKPVSWQAANIYAWGGTVEGEPFGEWPGTAMTQVDGEPTWFSAFVANESNLNMVFNAGQDQAQTSDLTDVTGGWYDGNAMVWLDSSPFGLSVGASPCDASFTSSQNVVLTLNGVGSIGSYTVSGSANMQDVGYSDGDSITIDGAQLAVGSSVTLSLLGQATSGETASKVCTYTKVEKSTGGASGLGAMYSPQSTTFAIWSPTKSNVSLELAGETYAMDLAPAADGMSDVYTVTVPGEHHLKEYNFVLNGTKVRDPYGVMVKPGTDTNIVVDLGRTEPPGGWAPTPPLVEREDAIIYELHVGDFTGHPTSGVSPQYRGKFKGLVEAGTRNGSVSTGLDHLKELGVTHIQILPFYDYGTCSEKQSASYSDSDPCYNWGYDPENFNVPEERYATDRTDYVNRIKELKETINELHKNGIRVIMDVVYNHSWSGGGSTNGETMFGPISQEYFWQETRSGFDSDLSGTGNALDPRQPMVSKMIQDSLEYWVGEYNIDGFRFDLVGIFDHSEFAKWADHLNAEFPDKNLLIYGEPWNGFANDSAEKDRVRLGTIGIEVDSNVGVFSPKFRDAIKGDLWSGEVGQCGFIVGNGGKSFDIKAGMRGSIRSEDKRGKFAVDTWDTQFANDPEQSINYVSAHDNYTIRDHIERAFNHGGSEDCSPSYSLDSVNHHKRLTKFANAMVLTAQGIPFIHSGAEMFRTKLVHNDWDDAENSYNIYGEINDINWDWKDDNEFMFGYYVDLIKLRKEHPGFRMNTWEDVNEYVSSENYNGDQQVVVTEINGAAVGDSWSTIIVVANSGDNISYNLPAGEWKVAVEHENANVGGTSVSGSHVVEGKSVSIFYQD